jgi:hypothetical protein
MAERTDISTQDIKYTTYTPKTYKKQNLDQITKSENILIENAKNTHSHYRIIPLQLS